MNNPKLRGIIYATAAAAIVSGCGADDIASPGEGQIVIVTPPAPPPAPPPPPPPPPTPTPTTGPAANCPTGTANVGTITTGGGQSVRNCQVSGIITGNLVIPNNAGTIYSLSGAVQVGTDDGATGGRGTQGVLTVEPGVTMFGSSGGDFLLINRGSQIFAEGSQTSPIIITSRQNVLGNTNVDSIGQWGGLVILGQAPISDCATGNPTNPGGTRTDCEAIVEGPANAVYGGTDANDSSGRISFLQIRYSGFEVSPGNELNGITLAGVGRGTFFQNVQVHNSSDDGIEWFGGRVNTKNIALTGNDDDSIDSDSGYKGFGQFFLVVQRPNGGDATWEADSNGNENAEPRQDFRISNATLVSRRNNNAILFRGGGDYALYNSIVTGPGRCIDIDGAATVQAAGAGPDENGPPVFQSVFLSCATAFEEESTPNITRAQIMTIFNNGTNNTANGTSTLQNIFINGANENSVTPFNASSAAAAFGFGDYEPVNYIGAVRDANDTRFMGWTCGLYANRACETAPVITG